MNIDHYAYLIDRQHRFLLLGLLCFMAAAVFLISGEALAPYSQSVTRGMKPKAFWTRILVWVLMGAVFLAIFLYRNSN